MIIKEKMMHQLLKDKIKNRTANIGIIGLGYVGLPTAMHYAQRGYTVMGFDVSEEKVFMVNCGKSYIKDVLNASLSDMLEAGRISADTDFTKIRSMDALVICVPTPIDGYKNPDLSYVESAVRSIAPHLSDGTLVLFESTTYPGTTDEVIVPIIEAFNHTVGTDVFVAYSPERVDPGNAQYGPDNTPKVVGGITQTCTEVAALLIGSNARVVSSAKVAEMSKVYENTFRYINMALANETAKVCHAMGINVWEVIDAAKTKPYGFMPFYPGVGVGGHCIPVDPYYLSYKAKEFGMPQEMINLAGKVNDSMRDFVFLRITDLLNVAGKPLKTSAVTVLGVSYKPDIGDVRESPVLPLLDRLYDACDNVRVLDPYVDTFRAGGTMRETVGFDLSVIKESDIVVLATAHSNFPYRTIAENAPLIFDAKNAFSAQGVQGNNITVL